MLDKSEKIGVHERMFSLSQNYKINEKKVNDNRNKLLEQNGEKYNPRFDITEEQIL